MSIWTSKQKSSEPEVAQFNTELQSAHWNEQDCIWTIETPGGTFTPDYLFTALGLVSDPNWPPIPSREVFKGERYHASHWPDDVDPRGKRVVVIGSGPSGMQLITAIAPVVGSLLSFQRHPQYTVPSGNRPLAEQEWARILENYNDTREKKHRTTFGMGVKESTTPAMSVSPEERERDFQAAWDEGCAFRFFVGTFCDIITDKTANRAACEFTDRKIFETVKDTEEKKEADPLRTVRTPAGLR